MAVITDKENELRDTIISALLEINAACYHVRKDQNTGDGSAAGLQVDLPKEVAFQVVFGKDGSISSIQRTQTTTPGDSSETSSEQSPERITTTESQSTKTEEETVESSSDANSESVTESRTSDSGSDSTLVERQYGSVTS